MTEPRLPADKRVTAQFIRLAVAEGLLMLGVLLYFYIRPQTTVTTVLAAVALALGIVAAVWTIYKAVPLMAEPATRTIGYASLVFVVGAPLILYATSFTL